MSRSYLGAGVPERGEVAGHGVGRPAVDNLPIGHENHVIEHFEDGGAGLRVGGGWCVVYGWVI